jgi:hypothetical protein
VCCASAGAERRGGVLCAGPAYVPVVILQGEKKERFIASDAVTHDGEYLRFGFAGGPECGG